MPRQTTYNYVFKNSRPFLHRSPLAAYGYIAKCARSSFVYSIVIGGDRRTTAFLCSRPWLPMHTGMHTCRREKSLERSLESYNVTVTKHSQFSRYMISLSDPDLSVKCFHLFSLKLIDFNQCDVHDVDVVLDDILTILSLMPPDQLGHTMVLIFSQ